MKLSNIFLLVTAIGFSANICAQEPGNHSHEKVKFLQKLDPDAKVDMSERALRKQSRIFYRHVSGKDLNKGVDFTMDAENGVIQLTPMDQIKNGRRYSVTTVPEGITLSNGKLRRSVDDESIAMHRSTEALRSASPELFGRAHAMRVPKDMGRGRFKLEANGNAQNNQDYVLYVLDKNSDIELNVESPKSRYAKHEKLQLNAFVHSGQKTKVEAISAELISPNGKHYQIPGSLNAGRFQTQWPINVDAEKAPGELWEVEVHSRVRNVNNEIVERVAVLATDIYEPTATLDNVEIKANTASLTLAVSEEGRYEARAFIYGTDYDGNLKPALLSYQAEWLSPGSQQLVMIIDENELLASGLSAPYEIQYIKLLNQSRLSVLEKKSGHWSLPINTKNPQANSINYN